MKISLWTVTKVCLAWSLCAATGCFILKKTSKTVSKAASDVTKAAKSICNDIDNSIPDVTIEVKKVEK